MTNTDSMLKYSKVYSTYPGFYPNRNSVDTRYYNEAIDADPLQCKAKCDEVSNCGSQRCEAQLSIDGLPERQGWLAKAQVYLATWRYEAFLVWLGIGFFQSFFIRSFRLLPWRPVIVRIVTRVPLEDID